MTAIFVSYCGNDHQGAIHLENVVLIRAAHIKTIEDIRDIEYSIEELRCFTKGTCKIISWQRMES